MSKFTQIVSLLLAITLMATIGFAVDAESKQMKIVVRACTLRADGDSLKDDILVSGVVYLSGDYGVTEIDVHIVVTDPSGVPHFDATKAVKRNEKSPILHYATTLNDIADEPGWYEVKATATHGEDLEAYDTFSLDPPGGGPGPPQY